MTERGEFDILYVDDEENNLTAFRAGFRDRYRIVVAKNTGLGREILEKNEVAVIISDQRMPEEEGVKFLEFVKKKYPRTIRILLTAFSDIEAVIQGINKAEIYRYLSKPYEDTEMDLTLKNALEIVNLRRENIRLMETLKQVNEQLEFMLRQQLIS